MTQVPLRAVVFDCDGVLVDSEPVHAQATTQQLKSLGTPIPEGLFERIIGMRVRDQMTIVGELTGHDPQRLFDGREERFWELIRLNFPAMPGAASTIRRLHEAGFAIGVASSGTREYVDYVVTALGVRDLVDAVTSGDDVRQPKPDPECYLRTATALGVPAASCAAVEDSELGVRSAAAARMHVLALQPAATSVLPHARRQFATLPAIADYLLLHTQHPQHRDVTPAR